jgi:hypothetical protein
VSNRDFLNSEPAAPSSPQYQSAKDGNHETRPNSTNRSFNKVKAECERVEQALATQAAQLSALQAQLSSVNAAYETGTQLLSTLRNRADVQTVEIQKAREDLTRSENDLNALRVDKAKVDGLLSETVLIQALRAEVADLKFQNSIIRSENEGLETEMEQIGDGRCEELRKIIQFSGNYNLGPHRSAPGSVTNAVAGPSRLTSHRSCRSPVNPPHIEESYWPCVSRAYPRGHTGGSLKQYHNDFKLAAQRQLEEFDEEVLHLCTQLDDWELVKKECSTPVRMWCVHGKATRGLCCSASSLWAQILQGLHQELRRCKTKRKLFPHFVSGLYDRRRQRRT